MCETGLIQLGICRLGGSLADIFLSYAHSDKPKVHRLANQLEAAGFTVWWDPDLAGGARFHKAIEAELRASKAVIVCWSKAAVESHWVIDEASIGRDEQRLVPVSLDGSEPPLGFRQFQVVDFSPRGQRRSEAMSKLLEALHPLVKSALPIPQEQTSGDRSRNVRPLKARPLLPVIALLALLAIGVGVFERRAFFADNRNSGIVAVFPIADLGGAPQTTKIAKSAASVIADLLGQYGEKVVAADRSLAATGPNRVSAAHDLNASYSVDGDVRVGADGTVVLTLHLFDAGGRPLWSHPFSAEPEEADYLPEQAATLLASLLTKKDQFNNPGFVFADDSQKFRNGQYLEAFVQAKRDLAASPNSPSLMLAEAAMGGLALAEIPREQRAGLVQDLRAQLKRASEMDPSIDARWGIDALTPSTEWLSREKLLAEWRAFHSPNSSALAATSLFFGQTGRVADAVPFAEQSIAVRPLSSLRLSLLGSSYFIAGRYQQAKDSMAQARRRWPEQPSLPRTEFMADLLLGKPNEAARLLANPRLREQIDPPAAVQPAGSFLRAVQSRSPADEAALAADCRDKDKLSSSVLGMCLIALNVIERIDDAFRLADQMFPDLSGKTGREREEKWLANPEAIAENGRTLFAVSTAPMRRDQRFTNLVSRLGLVEYWRSSGEWPDFCKAEPSSPCNELRQR